MVKEHYTGPIKGAIYDMDEVILDNNPTKDIPYSNLHQQARLVALHEVATRHGLEELMGVTAKDNSEAFHRAPVSTVSAAIWVVLHDHHLVPNNFDPFHPLILEMLELKNTYYETLLVEQGKPIKGAPEFISDFAAKFGIETKNAISSNATFSNIDTVLRVIDRKQYFPDSHIISVEQVTRYKPDPQGYDLAFQSLGLPNEDRRYVPVVEDDPRGMLAARRAGMMVYAIATQFPRAILEKVEAQPDLIVESYDELRDHFGLPPLPQ